ncbi:M24 family metallopeptidase [Halocalculus aciditolerans]|uniref:Peptidase M24 n=1 Tax=Halocalculus aciditolerans TaxID=1383812 RepID=A0A830F9X0_9EURY|nr:Xaa-Pro peptidase family protein [Halocalculus aciditolerans]GGL54063.1 peptidase M24 [Halocalculus aciditolerans]
MAKDFSALDAFLDEQGFDGYLLDADSTASDQYYLSGFFANDPFVTLYTPEETALLVSGLEYSRAVAESRADVVRKHQDYEYAELVQEHGQEEAGARVRAAFLDEFGVESVATNRRFPLATADGLRGRDVDVTADTEDTVTDIRAVKTEDELDAIREAQRANQVAMARVDELITDATVEGGELHYEGGVLTSERVKREVDKTLLDEGCAAEETIVACGADAAVPHNSGSGPLRANETIVVDVFPKNKDTHYNGDMTRTFVKGDPSAEAREFYELTQQAFDAAMDALEPGATGAEVHGAVCDVYENAGYPTLRSDPDTDTGYIHSTGHGIGLDVHEAPSVSHRSDEPLQPGHVVTIEPGLYDPDVGGVRLEDLVVVADNDRGYENYTDYTMQMVRE